MQTLFFGEYRAERRRVYFQLFDPTDGVTPETGEAGGQPSTYKHGAGAGVTTNVGALVATNATHGLYYSELGAAQEILAALGRHRVVYDSAATGPAEEIVEVVPHPWMHDGLAQGGAAQSITLQSDASAVNDHYNDAYISIIGGTGAGQTQQITDYVGSTKVATVAFPWRVQPDATSVYVIESGAKVEALGAVWDALTTDHVAAGSFGEAYGPIRRGTAQAGGSNTITLDALASAVTDFYKGAIVRIVSGPGAGQAAIISAYNGTTKVATVGQTWATQPTNASVFVLYGLGVIPGASAPTAGEVADAVWDEARSGHIGAGSFGEGVQLTANERAALADKFLARCLYGGSDNFPQVLFALAFVAGRWVDNGDGTISVMGEDDSTVIGTISFTTVARDAIGGINSSPAS